MNVAAKSLARCAAWVQRSLVALATLSILLVCIGGFTFHRTWQFRQAVAQIEKQGGFVLQHADAPWAEAGILPAVTLISFANSPDCSVTLEDLPVFAGLNRLELSGVNVTEYAFGPVAELATLEYLALDRTNVRDQDLEHIRSLHKLKTLNLSGTDVTDAGLVHLEVLSDLETLDIQGTRITDAGLRHLQNLPVTSLIVDEEHISVDSAEHLAVFPRLQRLQIAVHQGTGRHACELVSALADVQAEARYGASELILWRSTIPWEATTGGIIEHLKEQAGLNDEDVTSLLKIFTAARKHGDWSGRPHRMIRLSKMRDEGRRKFSELKDRLPSLRTSKRNEEIERRWRERHPNAPSFEELHARSERRTLRTGLEQLRNPESTKAAIGAIRLLSSALRGNQEVFDEFSRIITTNSIDQAIRSAAAAHLMDVTSSAEEDAAFKLLGMAATEVDGARERMQVAQALTDLALKQQDRAAVAVTALLEMLEQDGKERNDETVLLWSLTKIAQQHPEHCPSVLGVLLKQRPDSAVPPDAPSSFVGEILISQPEQMATVIPELIRLSHFGDASGSTAKQSLVAIAERMGQR